MLGRKDGIDSGGEQPARREVDRIDVARRHAQVLGDGPRIAPLEVDSLSPALQAIIARMIDVNAALGTYDRGRLPEVANPPGKVLPADDPARLATLPEIIRTMLRHADLFAAQTDLGIQLIARGALSARDRELAVLRVGWLCRAPYEWGEHVNVAKKVGIEDDEIERVTQGSAAPGWSDADRAILRAVEELLADAMISDATWATLAERLDERQLIELPILVGQYQAVAYYQNALRLRLHQGNAGLLAR
jgi:alkylhydroperoxidase family enzyme